MIKLTSLRQTEINWFLENDVPPEAIILPTPIMVARGTRASDGRFDFAGEGQLWFAIAVENDTIFWHPSIKHVATDTGRAFALGEELIGNPGVTALGGWLRIFANPMAWLQSGRTGIFVLPNRWPWAFEMLRDVERVAVAVELLSTYRKHMRPRLPELAILPKVERIAA